MAYEIVIPDIRLPKPSNQLVLELSVGMFLIFAISELIGALLSGSLSLLADSVSMFADVFSYMCNIYVEWYKANYGGVSNRSRFYLEIVIPLLSIIALLITTIYTTVDASLLILYPPTKDSVDVDFMYGFSIFNFVVDFVCWMLFSLKGKEAFFESVEIPQLSIDTSISFDDEADFGQLADSEFDDFNTPVSPNHFFTLIEFCKLLSFGCCFSNNPQAGDSRRRHTVIEQPESRSNLNMLSAFVHVAGDTMRTIAVFVAAGISTVFGIDGDICDAWAAILASLTILIMCSSLIVELKKNYLEIKNNEVDDEGILFSVGPKSSKNGVTGMSQSSSTDPSHVIMYRAIEVDED